MQQAGRQASGIRRVIADLMELVELQMRLFAIDGKEAIRRALFAMVLAVCAGAAAISAITVGLMGLGWLLHEMAGWPLGVCLLVVAVVAIVVLLGVLYAAFASLRRAASAMHESGAEFAENLQWFRETLRAESHGAAAVGYPVGTPEAAAHTRF